MLLSAPPKDTFTRFGTVLGASSFSFSFSIADRRLARMWCLFVYSITLLLYRCLYYIILWYSCYIIWWFNTPLLSCLSLQLLLIVTIMNVHITTTDTIIIISIIIMSRDGAGTSTGVTGSEAQTQAEKANTRATWDYIILYYIMLKHVIWYHSIV